MKETTRIYTILMTEIIRGDDVETKEDAKNHFETVLKLGLNVDDVVVEKVQDFVMEKDE
jgi:hypothetical protein